MEIESKKKTYNKRCKSNKRNRKVACHRNGNHGVMNKRQLREFFGHKFGATMFIFQLPATMFFLILFKF